MKIIFLLLLMQLSAIALGQSYSEVLNEEQSLFLSKIKNLENYNFYNIKKKISSEELELNDFNVRLLYSDSVNNALCNLLDKALINTAISPLYCLELCSYSHDSILIEKGRNLLNMAKSPEEHYEMLCYLTRMGDSNAIKNFLKYNKKRCVKDRISIMWDISHYYYTEEGIRFCANYIKSNAHTQIATIADWCIPAKSNISSPKDTIPDSEIEQDTIIFVDFDWSGKDDVVIESFEGSVFYTHYFWEYSWINLRSITNHEFWDCIGFPNPYLRKDKDDFSNEPDEKEFFTKQKRRIVYKWVKHNFGNYQLKKYMW